jgi:hypothetical protein
MPRTKGKSKLRPKARAATPKKRSGPRAIRHPELWGLGLLALGIFLGSVIYAGWNGGYVGGALADGLDAIVGSASWALPTIFVVLGCLMVARSALVDVRPFRTGLIVLFFGLMIALGRDQGGYIGQALGGAVGVAIGVTGSTILGILLLLVGALLLTGASLGAILRHSGHRVHAAATKARLPRKQRSLEDWPDPPAVATLPRSRKPVDAEDAYPDVVGDAPPPAVLAPSPLLHCRAGSARAGPPARRGPADAVRRGHDGEHRVQAAGRGRPAHVAGNQQDVGRDRRTRRRPARADARAFRRRGERDRPDLRARA